MDDELPSLGLGKAAVLCCSVCVRAQLAWRLAGGFEGGSCLGIALQMCVMLTPWSPPPPVADDTNEGATHCTALYDYAGQQEDELTFNVSLCACVCCAALGPECGFVHRYATQLPMAGR